MNISQTVTSYNEGDPVVVARGTYQGTRGVFLRLKEDSNWADITEPNGVVRSHPIAWMDHAAPAQSESDIV